MSVCGSSSLLLPQHSFYHLKSGLDNLVGTVSALQLEFIVTVATAQIVTIM